MKIPIALMGNEKQEKASCIRVEKGFGKSLFVKTFLMIIKRLWLI